MLTQTDIDEALTELEYIKNRCDMIRTARFIKLFDDCVKVEEHIRNNTYSRGEVLSSVELLMDRLNYLLETN